MCFDSVEEVVRAIAGGEIVIMTDDQDRENEGDLILAGVHATAHAVNFLITHGKGLVCVPLSARNARRLSLYEPSGKRDLFRTAFTQSVDAISGTSTGISAADRALTIRTLTAAESTMEDFYTPGHVFPLIAKEGGVLERRGHTEGVVDLLRLARLPEVGVLCEIINPDGSMARLGDLKLFKERFGLKMVSIEMIAAYRKKLLHKG